MASDDRFLDVLEGAEPRPSLSASQSAKKNYAERLSRATATYIANGLRPAFDGITPDPYGQQQEVKARTSKGFKKLDVGYSTPELGLGLGISIKTINYPDGSSNRYTKNYSRIDNELRAEATDYHVRQPFAVLAGILLLPSAAADNGHPTRRHSESCFAKAVQYFRPRGGRGLPSDDPERFELFFVGLYDFEGDERGRVRYFHVEAPPPRARQPKPSEVLAYREVLDRITEHYDLRNNPTFGFID